MRSGLWLIAAGVLAGLISGCDPLPGRLRTDPPGTALNTSSSRWYGHSSTGAYSSVRQVTTGLISFRLRKPGSAAREPSLW